MEIVVLSPDDKNADWIKQVPDRVSGMTSRQRQLEIHEELRKKQHLLGNDR